MKNHLQMSAIVIGEKESNKCTWKAWRTTVGLCTTNNAICGNTTMIFEDVTLQYKYGLKQLVLWSAKWENWPQEWHWLCYVFVIGTKARASVSNLKQSSLIAGHWWLNHFDLLSHLIKPPEMKDLKCFQTVNDPTIVMLAIALDLFHRLFIIKFISSRIKRCFEHLLILEDIPVNLIRVYSIISS